MSGLHEERAELAEDEEKLESALREYVIEWSEEEEEDEEDCLLIDLDKPVSISDITGRSISPSFAESGSQVNGQEDESAGSPSAPDLPQLSSKEAEISEAEKTLALNRALQGILEKHMDDIRVALEENRQNQQMLEDGSWVDDSVKKRKGRTFGPFRTPFFQNSTSFPPANEDVKSKKCSGELTYEDMHESLNFTRASRCTLMDGIMENLREELASPLLIRLEAEVKKGKDLDNRIEEMEESLNRAEEELKKFDTKKRPQKSAKLQKLSHKGGAKKLRSEMKELQEELAQRRQQKKDQTEILAAVEDEIELLKENDCSVLLPSLDMERMDWMKISKMRFGEKTSWLHCRKEWEHVLNPSLNRGNWPKTEDDQLVELVKKYPSGKWDVIAKELGTNRTPFMCLNHYQRYLNPEFKTRPWTEEEDKHLLAVTRNMRENSNLFSWRKVSALVDSRSWTECFNRFSRLDEDMNHGRWTKEEDARLLAAIEILGPSWTKISWYMRHRTPVQIRDRYTHCLDPNLNFSFFTYDEDVKLIRLYRNGVSWTTMLKDFEGRTDSMLYARLKTLKGWQKEMEWWQSQMPETQKMLLGKSLIPAERKTEEQQLKAYYSTRLGITEHDYERRKRDFDNGVDPELIPPRPPMHLMYTKCSKFRRAHNMERWSNKLAFQARLKDKLKYLIAKEHLKVQRPNDKKKAEEEETEEEKETIMKVINQTADETLQGFKPISRQRYQDMYNALNRYFLGETKINVKELLQACKLPKKRYPRKKPCLGIHVNVELNSILRNNNRCMVKRGRNRKLLPRDGRSVGKIKTEFEEVKRSIDVLLFECLGPGFSHFCHTVSHRNLDVEEELLSAQSYKEDEQYKKSVKAVEHRMAEVRNHPFLKPFQREKDLSKLQKTLNKLKSLVRGHYDEKRRKVECVLEEMHRDVEYIDNLKERQSELPKELLSHMSVNENCSKAARQLIASPMTSAVLMPQSPHSGTKESSQEDVVKEETTHISRTASLRKRKQAPEHPEAPWKKLRCKSVEEVNNERLKLPLLKDREITDVPYLPPTHCTLVALRALLLNRQELLKQAGDMYNAENYHKNASRQIEKDGALGCAGISFTNGEKDGTRNVEVTSCTDDSDRGLDSYFKQPGKDILPKEADTLATTSAITSSSSCPTGSVSVSCGQRVVPQQNQSQRLEAIKSFESTLGRHLRQFIPAKKESAYEVSVGVSAPTRCFKHIAQTDCEKLPEDEMAPTPSPAVAKALQIPKVTHKVYIPECVDIQSPHGRGSENKLSSGSSSCQNKELNAVIIDERDASPVRDYEKELRTQMKVAADFAMSKFLRRKNTQSAENVVVVGVDPVTRNIVHFKSKPGSDELTQVEAKAVSHPPRDQRKVAVTATAATTATTDLQMVENSLNPPEQQVDANIIHAIRQTVEYRTFAARMRSLFMWPILLSTTPPPEVPKLTAEEKAARPKRVEKGKRRYLTKDGRRGMKQWRREKREAKELAKREAKAAGQDLKIKMRKPKCSVQPKLPPEPKSGRPVRKVRLKAEAIKAKSEKSTPSPWSRVVPTWWKEAILEAMLTRQAIERGEIARDEKNLSEDEDFHDKGNYSEDETWLAPLLEREKKEKEAMRRVEEAERERREREGKDGEEEEQEEEGMEVEQSENPHSD